ncbi:shikimate kinase [Variovorax boronicumulans]|uniref:shikimate kinase n=1 Tax=Variovorax boronicumulans TaxID=436515 RepID=UPI001C56F2EC
MSTILHLVGPGGAGKTSVGPLLGARLDWQFLDLDAEFMDIEGDIAQCISTHGYEGYARRNLSIYLELRQAANVPTVLALSSGFLTYATDMDPRYAAVRRDIETNALTALLLPSFELERCVDVIVSRQLARPYLAGNGAREEQRIRARFPLFVALQCTRFQSDTSPMKLAAEIELFARKALSMPASEEVR